MRILCLLIIQISLVVLLSNCGGGVSGENGSDPFGDDDTSTTESIKIGYFDTSGQFVEGEIGVTLDAENGVYEISAGGSVGLVVTLVDEDNQRVADAYSVSFTSNCVTAEQATMDSDISIVNGEAASTFTDDGCAGSAGTQDQITASVTISDETLTATQDINIRPEVIGGISFSSASLSNILLQGSGDASQSQSTLTFAVSNDRGDALANQTVTFSLTTEIGGLTLSDTDAITNSEGEASVDVIAGNVPTPVRVNASVMGDSGEVLTTQSDAISVTTGLPNQRSFSLATDIFNIEGHDFDGNQANIIARLSDTLGNPVPDNTVVNFTTEGGQIESSCQTADGACSVAWTSANPRTTDGVVTILATAIGHETLFDSNGSNTYDQEDGDAIYDDSDSGFEVSEFTVTGFVDMAEAWRDDNENSEWDAGEPFLDYNNNQQYDLADGLFNGPQCDADELCGQGVAATIHVRKALTLIVSGSDAYIDVFDTDDLVLASNYQTIEETDVISLARGEVGQFSVTVGDIFNNTMPANTSVDVTATAGTLTVTSGTVFPNRASRLPSELTFTYENDLEEDAASVVASLRVLVTTPEAVETSLQFNVTLD